jgi:hypothetical protein
MTDLPRMDRRQAIKWMLSASAILALPGNPSLAASRSSAKGYGTDPNLLKVYNPGDVWPLSFSPSQRKAAAALSDVILPADSKSPGASQLKVHDFIDEWISAPYPRQQSDRPVILSGLAWLERESQRRFGRIFPVLAQEQQHAICDDICFEPKAAPAFKQAAAFFNLFRDLTMAGFYTTPEGWKDIQYLGNVPLTRFDGPPPEVLAYLKLT